MIYIMVGDGKKYKFLRDTKPAVCSHLSIVIDTKEEYNKAVEELLTQQDIVSKVQRLDIFSPFIGTKMIDIFTSLERLVIHGCVTAYIPKMEYLRFLSVEHVLRKIHIDTQYSLEYVSLWQRVVRPRRFICLPQCKVSKVLCKCDESRQKKTNDSIQRELFPVFPNSIIEFVE